MSAVIERFIICDTCGEPYGVDCRSDSINEHRMGAKQCGWKYREGKDICDECVEKETKD